MNFLGLKHPLIVAPMAGGPTTPELVIASCEAGALGSIGAAYLTPDQIIEFAKNVRRGTSHPFAINLFVPASIPPVSEQAIQTAVEATQKFRMQWGLPSPELTTPYEENFDRQFEAVMAVQPKVLSFVFGLLPFRYLKAAKAAGIVLMGTATTPEEAAVLEASGVDAVILQGVEGGGHRGIFDPLSDDPDLPLADLLAKVKPSLKIPLIAAGGIMNAKDIQSALRAGAQLVQMGTAFLLTTEAGTSAAYRARLADSRPTKLTRAFSGRLARGLINSFMLELEDKPEAILPFPAQNKFTRDIRKASAEHDSSEALSLWCGTGAGELWTGTAADLIKNLFG